MSNGPFAQPGKVKCLPSAGSRPDHIAQIPFMKRRILSIDGGGIRGFFAIEVLARMEALLRAHHGKPSMVLADHFQLIAGTSTGAIIGAMLAWGETVDAVREMYRLRAAEMFKRAPLRQIHRAKYRHEALTAFLKDYFREDDGRPATLGTAKLRTLVLIVFRNASRGSAWPVTNNPAAIFNRRTNADGSVHTECNLDLPLWQLVRGSTAAPWFFPPETVRLGSQEFLFVDGGITPYNNPALIAALTATLPCYRLEWPRGPDRLLVVSVGTGRTRTPLSGRLRALLQRLSLALLVPRGLMETISQQQDMLCRVLGDCKFGDAIDLEVGDLIGVSMPPAPGKQFAYVRYNKLFTPEEVAGAEALFGRFELDNLRLAEVLQEAGKAYAAESVRLEHLL